MPSLHYPTWSTVAVCGMLAASPAPVHALARSPTPASVQDRADLLNSWTNVAALASGTRLRVELADRTRIAGTLASVSPDRLVILAEGGASTVVWRRDQVTRIEQRGGPCVRAGAGWGALVGVLVGAIALGTIEPRDAVTQDVLRWHELPVLVTGTAIGVGTGSAINLARRPRNWAWSRSQTVGEHLGTSSANDARIPWWTRKGSGTMKTRIVGVLACSLVGPAIALAGQSQTTRGAERQVQVATLDELRRALSPGDVISVVRTTGDSVRGRLLRFGDADIDLQAETQYAPAEPRRSLDLRIPLGAIQALERPRDSSRNGALLGASVGGGLTLAGFAYAAAVDSNEIDEWGPIYLALGGIYTGLGALAGWAIDRAHSKPHIRFDAPSPGTVRNRTVPFLSRGRGLVMVLSF